MTPNENASSSGGDDLVDRIIGGNFRIERLIGSGAMGNVYQAEQLSLGKAVALKVLHPHLMVDDKLIRRFQREAKSASRLNHPNSIQIIDSGHDTTGVLYIAMELLTGRDLGQVIRDEFPLPIPRIVRIMSQVLSALDEAHTHGVIHRDLKPSNIMLIEQRGEADFVKVCDYGIAKAQLDDDAGEGQMLTIQGLVCGTPEYMSPEQARGEPLDGRADLYSAAVILYQLVTGDIPFRAATPLGIVSRHLSEAPAVPSSCRPDPTIPPTLDDLILRGLAKSRELRPLTANRFLEELQSIGAGRSGRHARASSSTVPAGAALLDAAPTDQIPAAARMATHSSFGVPARGSRMAKGLSIGLVLAAGAAAAAMVAIRRAHPPGAATASTLGAPAVARASDSVTPPPVRAELVAPDKPAAIEPAPTAAVIAEAPAAEAPAIEAAPRTHVVQPANRDRGVRRKHDDGSPSPTTPAGTASTRAVGAGTSVPVAATEVTAVGRAAQGGPGDAPAPSVESKAESKNGATALATGHGARELIGEGEKLLAQGDTAEACRRGEDAKKAAPGLASVYKFLGKCYMRAGNVGAAKDSYRRYLELAPNAPDAVFIESIIK